MNSIKELIAYIDNEFNHIDILEKEYGLSAKKLSNPFRPPFPTFSFPKDLSDTTLGKSLRTTIRK